MLQKKFQIKINWKVVQREILDYFGILIGVILTALAIVWLLIPNKIAAGGVSGLATVFYYLWGWPVSIVMLIINIPLFLSCLWVFGPRYGGKTLFGTAMISLAIEFWQKLIHLEPLTKDPLLAALYGGVISGIGIGIAFRFRGTTGGTDLAARLLHHFTGISIGRSLMFFDGAVIVFAGFVFKSSELALYAIMTIFVCSKVIDTVLEGLDYAKAAFIISSQPEIIGQKILTDLGRGVTGLFGRGLYSTDKKEVLLCVISRAEEIRLKELVKQVDPRAFVIITDVHEVLGEGFKDVEAG